MTTSLESARQKYAAFVDKNLKLNMTRGKPAPEQLDLSKDLLTVLGPDDVHAADNTDCRNYGVLRGLPEALSLFADYLEVGEDEILIGGNASLNLMHDAVTRAVLHGVPGGDRPWGKEPKITFLCPAPGYDRHFNICSDLGIDMITVPMNDEGPCLETVKKLVAEDASIKGIWCVPRYSNPTGITYADHVVEALATMKTAAADFRIFWDNAYHAHHLVDNPKPLRNILEACKAAGNPNRVYIFGSTSKITFAGSGVAVMGCSKENMDYHMKHLFNQTIGFDKLNQLRHVRFFGDMDGLRKHMQAHAAILKPKFDAVDAVLTANLGASGLATWSKPEGGYFVSLDTKPGLAKRVIALAKDAGVQLTAAGATFPNQNDPEDRNIRIAPSLPSLDEITLAMEVVCACIELASQE